MTSTPAFVSGMEQSHGRQLRRFLSNRLRNAAADVPDLVQEVFLRLLRIKDHESIRNPQAYLYTVALHVLHQHTLRSSNRPTSTLPADMVADLDSFLAGDPAEEAELEDRFEKLGAALHEESPRAYMTLLMYRCEGATLEQIGARLGVSRVMAKKYLVKALAFCQQRLAEGE
ncbi:RNA polymerase sigma factor [Peristeroidobacter soli]|uniref:RNA polymerase sigma factor n=1 Tax=Peristeroidobacter soli TaxID=2497877 RepID=UPI00101BF7E3|nr:RNA polymerase sigma factor [Peristeroidobacter soli]